MAGPDVRPDKGNRAGAEGARESTHDVVDGPTRRTVLCAIRACPGPEQFVCRLFTTPSR